MSLSFQLCRIDPNETLTSGLDLQLKASPVRFGYCRKELGYGSCRTSRKCACRLVAVSLNQIMTDGQFLSYELRWRQRRRRQLARRQTLIHKQRSAACAITLINEMIGHLSRAAWALCGAGVVHLNAAQREGRSHLSMTHNAVGGYFFFLYCIRCPMQ